MFKDRTKFYILAALTIYSGLASVSWGRAVEKIADFNIPPQPLDSALIAFSKQADVQVSVASTAIAGMRTQGVVGRFTPSAALTRLLTATGLEFSAIGSRTYSVAIPARHAATMLGQQDGSALAGSPMNLEQARADGGTMGTGAGRTAPELGDESRKSPAELGEVLVTGTHIAGERPLGSTFIVLDRQDIARAGHASAFEIVRALPQNFGGGPSEDTTLGIEAQSNASAGTSLNLRGLGAGATLILVNGHRLAGGGSEGAYTDVSNIPIAAIERVEVITDGASAIYGAEAVGGVVNYIMRKDYEGAETTARLGSVTSGGSQEYLLSQVLGTSWHSGNALVSLELYDREALPAAERDQAADSDLTQFGGSDFDTVFSNPGTITIGPRTWAIPRGQDGQSLAPADLIEGTTNLQNQHLGRDLLGEQKRRSAVFRIAQSIGAAVGVAAEGFYTKRSVALNNPALAMNITVPSTNPFYVNPTGATTPIRIAYSLLDDLGARTTDVDVETFNGSLGADWGLGSHWSLATLVQYGLEKIDQRQGNQVNGPAFAAALADPNPATAFNPFGDGSFTNPATVESIRASTAFTTDSIVRSANLTAQGPLFALPAGAAKVAIGVDYREQDFSSEGRTTTGVATSSPLFERTVKAAFTELHVPIFSEANRHGGLERLEFSLAGRHDRYDDFGSTTNPRFGALWSPVRGFALQGAWGTSFRAPNLADLNESTNIGLLLPLPDTQSPTGSSTTLLLFGKNADLSEETAETWTIGAEFAPPAVPALILNLHYFNTDFKDRIRDIPFSIAVLEGGDRFSGLVVRNPTAAQLEEACSRGTFRGTPEDCRTLPVAIADFRIRNTNVVRQRGLDFTGSLGLDIAAGAIELGVNATYLLDYAVAETPSVPEVSLVDTVSNPVRLRARGELSWRRGPWNATLFTNYADGYTDNVSVPSRKIDSWATADLQFGMEIRSGSGAWLDGFRASLNVQNVFDSDPPFVNNAAGLVGYDQENADLLGRFVSLQLSLEW